MRDDRDFDSVLLADDLTLQAFMLQVAIELGRSRDDPLSWARGFIDDLYDRIDAARPADCGMDRIDPVHELATARLDKLDRMLTQVFGAEQRMILR